MQYPRTGGMICCLRAVQATEQVETPVEKHERNLVDQLQKHLLDDVAIAIELSRDMAEAIYRWQSIEYKDYISELWEKEDFCRLIPWRRCGSSRAVRVVRMSPQQSQQVETSMSQRGMSDGHGKQSWPTHP